MKILHLSKYYHPYRGGIEKVIKELSEAALRAGHEVTVICSNETNEKVEEQVNGVHVIRLPKWMTVFSQPVTPSIFWSVNQHFQNADIIHLHAPNPLFEMACLSFDFQAPLIVTYHCEVMKARWLNNLYQPVSKAILERAERIFVATPYHIEYSNWLKAYANKCVVIPFGIASKYEDKNLEMLEKMKQIKLQYDRYFLFVGRMVTYKGVNVLLQSMKSIPQNLVLIGKGPFLQTWKELSRELGVEKRVHFLGGVDSDQDFAAYIHGCDALVLPSINEAEAFGLVLLEAMSCKKPVITTQLKSGVRFVNQDGITGISVPPRDSEALAQAMKKMMHNDSLRFQLGEAAYKHFRKNFLVEQCLQKHLDVYQMMIERVAA